MVRVVPHDPAWAAAFQREAALLTALLGSAAGAVHHIGSTSVPGLCAKPVLDVLVETPALARVDQREPEMSAAGYEARGEYGVPGRRYFSRPAAPEMKAHVHVFEMGAPDVARHLGFRDYLRLHHEEAVAYCALKRRLARAHPLDPAAYQAGKADFIARIESLAAASAERAG